MGSENGSLLERYLRRKSVEAVARDAEESNLERTLTAFDLVILGLGAMIGAGIFVAVDQGAILAGPAVAISYIVAATACIFAALCYAELSAAVPASGMAYSYAFVSLGQLAAWLIAWNLVAEYLVGNVAVAAAWSDNLELALQTIGIDIPQALTAAPGTSGLDFTPIFDLPAFLIVSAITVLLAVGVRESATTNLVLTVFKIGVLFAFIALGALKADASLVTENFVPNGASGVMSAAAVVFFAFIGFDAVAAAAEETKNPQRNLPIGIIGSLVGAALIYVAVSLVFVALVPPGTTPSGAALAEALRAVGYGDFVTILVAFGGVAATTTVLLVFQLGIPRILMALSRDNMMPGWLGKIHPRFATPARLTLLTGAVTAIGAGLIPIADAITFTSLATLFVYLVISLAVLALRNVRPDLDRPFEVPVAPLVVLGAVVGLGALIVSLNVPTFLQWGAWMGVGLILYGLYGARRGLAADDEAETPPVDGAPPAPPQE
ncbi:amino acid permease [Thermoplasmatales archaeon SW_10_69_26]|nr:MAG: amino acid permease [Thermoplasmatales archaeon SW_10_69_26]